MPTRNPRINVVLDASLYQNVQFLAKKEGVSLSLKVRDLIKEALESYEDGLLADFAETREATFDKSKALNHDDVWSF
ncbi:MAG: toxin-antitoxin system, antitoxin component [Candidatus Tectomicrobia bacterium]|uniref:Toxin-antitoxin system, antitoxin component n=1 Tax=Tectimicrobiota bacterium TaxID=2528274 RepID=A0A933LPA8_UNCTE|nr:toxin-antitoxin system, antitoxin component [Candidatus Tectomicrobia bacterium]